MSVVPELVRGDRARPGTASPSPAPPPDVRSVTSAPVAPSPPPASASTLGFAPERWLGAPAPGGLALPSATPAADTLYAPRGVWHDDERLVVADSGNHRVLVWHRLPERDHAPADTVLGQSDMASEGPRLLHLPTGVAMIDGRLVVADAWHHRLLAWNGLPGDDGRLPDRVIGQLDLRETAPNRGSAEARRDGFYWPYGFGVAGGRFLVADTGNRRLVGWWSFEHALADEPPRFLVGQDDWHRRGENRDGPVAPTSFRWPHAIASTPDGRGLLVADAGNHRVLGWRDVADACDGAEPDLVLGQDDLVSAREWPYGPQGPAVHRFPYGLSCADGVLAVADTANNRVLLHEPVPTAGAAPPADGVLAQPDMDANGENRWHAVEADSLCWPYGLHLHGGRLAVADSGNNRVTLWTRS